MNKLEELIQKLCPNGVEYKPLGELCEIKKGKQLNKDGLLEQGKYPVINGGINPSGYWNEYNFEKNLITISQGGASAGYVNFITTRFWAGAHCYVLVNPKNCLNYRLLYHIVKNYEKELMSAQVGAGIPSVSSNKLASLSIPVPPIEVQEEIVRILDKFTELSAELTAELTARKKQYEFYRDKLILEQENVEYKTLGEIATEMYRGSGIKRDELTPEGISCVRYGEIYTTYDVWFDKCVSHTNEQAITSKKYFENGDILFAITGESVEEIAKSCAYTGNNKCLAGGDIVVMKHKQNPKYLAYALSTTDAQRQKSYGKIKSKVVHASVPSIKLISIPLPPLAVQEKIASILDNFHSLVTDISEGLPAEIEARQKQYEYYRDKLLTFEEIAQ